MKAYKFLLGTCLGFVLASYTGDKVRDFMPGTYVNSAGGEFSIASDTFRVELVEGNNYQVLRRTGYNLISDGIVGAREHQTEQWTCTYSTATKTLTEQRRGKVISFFPSESLLKVGTRADHKIVLEVSR